MNADACVVTVPHAARQTIERMVTCLLRRDLLTGWFPFPSSLMAMAPFRAASAASMVSPSLVPFPALSVPPDKATPTVGLAAGCALRVGRRGRCVQSRDADQ